MLRSCVLLLMVLSTGAAAQNGVCIPVVVIAASQNNSCLGTPVTCTATIENAGTNGVYKWKTNNLDAGAANNPAYTSTGFRDGDVVTCEYSCKTACGRDTTVISKPVTIHVINDITPVITISNTDSIICEGELTLFTSQSFYGNAVPSYQWLVNGSPVGTNSPSYSTTSLTNGARVECVLRISTPGCPGPSRSATSRMNIYVYPMIHPTIKITPDKTEICRGEAVTFTATANGGAFPGFAWEVNGTPTGDVTPALVTSTLKNGDSVSCTITIDQDSRCRTTTSAPSNKVGIRVKDFTDPTVAVTASDLEVCAGTAVSFTATAQHAGTLVSYQWQVNGRDTGANAATFITNRLANGDKVVCILTTDVPGCPITVHTPSNENVVTVQNAPVITFSPAEIEALSGEPVRLHASVTGNMASFNWTPADAVATPQSLTPTTIPLTQSTTFTLTVVGTNGCTAGKSLVVTVLRRLHMPSAFTPNNDGINDVFRIPPDVAILLDAFSVFDRWGNLVFKTSDIAKGWDGTYRGQQLNTGTYVYLIKGAMHNKEVVVKGTVTLIK